RVPWFGESPKMLESRRLTPLTIVVIAALTLCILLRRPGSGGARVPALRPHRGSPAQESSFAYASLCVGDAILSGTLVLFHSLRKVNANADLVAMTYNVSEESLRHLHRYGVRTYPVEPLEVETVISSRLEAMEARDDILWTKLRVWQLEDYTRVIMMDADLLVLRNSDELFEYPELAACPMADQKEKIQFYQTAEYGLAVRNKVDRKKDRSNLLPGWSGLNSGVTVLAPSNLTFTLMMNELSIIPHRPCCPSQEFIFHYFEERGRFFRLPLVYNSRLSEDGEGGPMPLHIKIYHFVSGKPWKKRDSFVLNKIWWQYKEEVDAMLGLQTVE
ncbi:hypothetical protein HK101_005713, partial [Irineochytrium annulatum]